MSSQGSESSKIVHQRRPFIFFEPIDCASFVGAPDICFRQYNSGAVGGVAVGYPDGTSSLWHVNDQNGTSLNQASAGSSWLNRCADISMGGAEQVAPSSLSVVVDSTTGAGAWSIYYGDMSITSTNGTVTQINLGSASQLAVQGAGISGTPTANWETVSETNDPTSAQIAATHYLATDHLGSSQMEFSQGGWPVSSKQFGPYGSELNSQTTLDHYKFTGKERDSESGLDYFGARYFGSETGRFMSPDWAAKAEPVPYAKLADPQTLNLYAYAGNNPLSQIDTDGHLYGQANQNQFGVDENDPYHEDERLTEQLNAERRAGFGVALSIAAQQATQGGPSVTFAFERDNIVLDHVSMYVSDGPSWLIYDPDGSYATQHGAGSGDIVTDDNQGASRDEWLSYQRAQGNGPLDSTMIWTYTLSPADAKKIMSNALKDSDSGGNSRPLPCAHSISTVVSGVGPFNKVKPVFVLPASLAREVYPIPHRDESK